MNAMSEPTHVANDIGTALTIADRNATAGGELAVAAGKVIALRTALGVAGMADPAKADHRELARILPEKSEAVAAAGSILLQRSGQVAQQVLTFAVGEMIAASDATWRLAACSSPAALATAQRNLGLAWAARVLSQSITLGTIAMRSQHAAMAPFHRVATANADRLSR